MKKMIQSFKWAMHGLRTVWKEEKNFRIQVLIGFFVVVFGGYVGFSLLEWMIVAACITSVLSAEMVNTAVEDLCNKIEPNTDSEIGKIKDIMAGFVFLVCLASAGVGAVIIGAHLLML